MVDRWLCSRGSTSLTTRPLPTVHYKRARGCPAHAGAGQKHHGSGGSAPWERLHRGSDEAADGDDSSADGAQVPNRVAQCTA